MINFRKFTRGLIITSMLGLTVGGLRAIKIGYLDYKILSEEERTVDVAWGEKENSNVIVDSLFIPSSIIINDTEYTVTEIRENGFCSFPGTFLDIPASIEVVNKRGFFVLRNVDSLIFKPGLRIVKDEAFLCGKFRYCFLPPTIEQVGEMAFWYCCNLESFEWPDSIEEIPYRCFANCPCLKTFDFKNVKEVALCAFDCSTFDSLTIPSGIHLNLGAFFNYDGRKLSFEAGPTILDDETFYAPRRLEELEICEGVSLGSMNFVGAMSLRKLIIHDNVTFRSDWNFRYPRSNEDEGEFIIDSIIYLAKTPQKVSSQFTDYTYKFGTLYVLPEAVETAKETYPWSEFRHIEPLNTEEMSVRSLRSEDKDEEKLFTLDGRECNKAIEKLSPGIYIRRKKGISENILIR